MRNYLMLLILTTLLAACSVVGGSNAKVTYHTLSTSMTLGSIAADKSSRIQSVGIGPLKLTSLLDRKGYVVREDANTVQVRELHEWGGELQDEFLTTLTQQVQNRLPRTRVQRIPWEITQTPRYQVSLVVTQFDGQAAKEAVLIGTWQLQYASDGRIISTHPFQLSAPVPGKTMGAIVKAQTLLVERLAQAIVEQLP
ncbi:MAG: PqiC family protein [Thiofilum sp.]|uniref:PqiC family protein n=1 Tax=Thiofilum sp. TaxID=2212733 RepID=UPI002600C621|nr:PqiC family protein [Thiofilum sp.]MBK8454128.1 membrane integrity-associated transporter subunit PqiC [Thiofilum sp.]